MRTEPTSPVLARTYSDRVSPDSDDETVAPVPLEAIKYSRRIGRDMGVSEILEGTNLSHRQMGAIMIGWLVLVIVVSVALLLYTSFNFV